MTREDVAGKVVLLLKKEFKGKMNNWRTRSLVTGFSFCARKVLVLFLKKDEKKKKKKVCYKVFTYNVLWQFRQVRNYY